MKHSGWHARRPQRFGGVLEELESRLLFNADASALIGVDPNADPNAPTTHTAEVQVQTYAPPSQSTQTSSDSNDAEMQASTHVVARPVELVFVDSSVKDAQDLIASIVAQQDGTRTLEIHWLDSDRDGVAQINDVLQERQNVAAVHLITHGMDGALQLGATRLDADSLATHAANLSAWGLSMTGDADLLIYGCDVATSDAGQRFVSDLGLLTGMDVAASTDDTGARALGGDWDLEFHTGRIDALALATQAHATEWQGLLGMTAAGGETLAHTTTGGTSETTTTNRQVAMDSSGNYVVVWQDGTNVKAQRYTAAGAANGGVLSVSTSGSANANAEVVMNSSGAFVVVWNDSTNTIKFQRYNASGVAQGGNTTVIAASQSGSSQPWPHSITTYTPSEATIGIDSSGNFIIAYKYRTVVTGYWSAGVPSGSVTVTEVIQFRAYTSAGALQGTNGTGSISSTTEGNGEPSIAVNDSGAFVVSYTDSSDNIFVRRYTAARVAAAAAGDITGGTGGSQSSVAINATGNYVVAYNDAGIIKYRTYDSAGTATSAVTQANQNPPGSTPTDTRASPSAAIDSNGNFTISWQNTSQDGSSTGIYMRQFLANGTVGKADTLVNTTTSGAQQAPSVAINGTNGVVVWNGNGAQSGQSDTQGVFFQRYDLTTTASPPGAVTTTGTPLSYTENATTAVDSALSLASDPDSDYYTGAVISITSGFVTGQDVLAFTNQNGITGTYNATTGILTLTGSASIANYQTALRSITYNNSSQDPNTGTRTVTFQVSDGQATASNTRDITVASVNDAPTLTASAANPTFTEAAGAGNQAAAVSIYSGAAASTVESGQTITSLTFTISGIQNGANERITVDGSAITLGGNSTGTTTTNGMDYSVTIVGSTATITLTKPAGISTAATQTLVNGITYQNTAVDTPTAGNRVFTLTQTKDSGGTANSGSDTATLSVVSTVNVVAANDTPVISSNGGGASASISVSENGTAVTTVVASDPDHPSLTYSISGGADAARFSIDASTGVLTFSSAPNYESPTDSGGNNVYDVVVRVSDGTLTDTQTLAVTVTDVDEFNVGAVTDSNGAANTITENAANTTTVGLTVVATDADGSNNTITYSLSDNAGGRFTIHSSTGVVTVANGSLLNYELATSHSITVLATSADGSSNSQSFTINVSDVDEFNVGAVTDANGAANSLAEGSANGTAVGITASASDADGSTNTITYSLSDSAGGRFTIGSGTGIVTVANSTLLNYESATSHNITVLATSADGSTSSQSFTISLTDVDEFNVGAVTDSNGGANSVAENSANGTTVGVTASASDADGSTNTITYSLTDTAGGRFTIGSGTGIITVANGTLLNYESATSHSITVLATSADGSTSSQSFTINIGDVDEFNVGSVTDTNGAANSLAEGSANGTAVGITASASDADGSNNTITYTLTDSAGGRFTIGAGTGIVTVANNTLLNYESATSHNITVLATSADGSTSSLSFTIALTDVDEFNVGAVTDSDGTANAISETASDGDTVGITATASDADASNNTITYSLTDDAGGRFTIDSSTGVVTVANALLLDYETDTSHNITVQAASSDGSTNTQLFTIQVIDVNDTGVGAISDTDAAANTISEGAINGAAVGITASATDPDVADVITYSLSNDAGGRFTIDINTGVVTVLDASLLDREAAASHNITVLATSSDTSTNSRTFTITLSDVDEFNVGAIGDTNGAANSVAENAANGATVGITANATDADATTNTISYSLSDSAGGRFTIDASTGVVTVVDGSLLDREIAASHDITVVATSADGSTNSQVFTISLSDVNESDVGAVSDANAAANTVSEGAANGDTVGLTASATDSDATNNAISYTLSDDAGGLFAIDVTTGVVTVADSSLLDRETADAHNITVLATSSDGSTSSQTFTINVSDVDEFNVGAVSDSNGAANGVAENAADGTIVGITATATDADATNSTISYSLSDSAGGRFAIDASTGVITVANGSLLDRETAASHNVTVLATSTDGSTNSQTFTVNVSDIDEFDVGTVSDSNAAANAIAENAINGTTVGVTVSATDGDATTNTITYSLSDSAGGRFAIDAITGVVTVADSSLLDYELATSHAITVLATSADGSSRNQIITINVSDVDEFDISAVSDGNAGANAVSEDATNGSAVGITASASDADASATVSYSLSDSAGGRFTIDASTGVVTVADHSLLDREAAGSHDITVVATSSDGSFSSQSFTISVSDANEFAVGTISDSNAAADSVAENAANGTTVGITASATDADATTNTITYSLSDNAGGRFTIDASSGIVTVADGSLLDREAAASHDITVLATSADGSTSTQSFTINLSDVDEVNVGAVTDSDVGANTVAENAADGSTVGITGTASDADATTNTITYSLSDSAGGRFTIDASTGVVTVADGSLLDRESAASHDITILATSADGSTSTQSFTITLTDVDEFDTGTISDANAGANSVTENAANGTTVGITAAATDADATTNTITYSLSDDGGGRFAIDASTGVITVANGTLLDREAAFSHTVTVLATSADGSTNTQNFTISLTDVDEFDIGAVSDSDASANSVAENATNGTMVGISARATDADATATIAYTLNDDAGGRFAIDSVTGAVTVANTALLNYESATSHSITVLATSSDGTTNTQTFTISLTDVDEFDVGAVSDTNAAANSVSENAANGTVVGITAIATDADATTNTVTYTLTDDAGGRFTIDASTGVVTVADGSLLDREASASHDITVLATSADGSTSSQSFTISLTDIDEFNVGAVSDNNAAANSVAENAANGTVVGITANATDADATTNNVTYALTDDAGGRFTIDAATGVVTVADGSLLDREAAASHGITVRATGADGSTSDQSFTINLSDADEFNVGAVSDNNAAANSVAENAANGTVVGITAIASDADATTNTVTYTLTDDAGGRFTIDATTGVVTVADGSLLDREAAASHGITVRATSADGSTSDQSFTINLNDIDEFNVSVVTDANGTANSVAENAANGTVVGITAIAADADATTSTVTYSLTDDAGGRFAIDATTGVVTVADGSLLDREAAASHGITVRATSADGSTSDQSFTINLSDVDEFNVGVISDANGAANSVAENAANGTTVGITVSATDADATTNTVTYTLTDNAGGRFTIDASTGVITVADGSLLDHEAVTSHNITVLATSADGSTSSQNFTINLGDVDEFDVGAVTDTSGAANTAVENAANGATVGITANATDADSTTNTVTYTLSDNAGGRFTIDASTGVVTVANGSLLNYEAATSHNITITATSADGSSSSQTFTINLSDTNEFSVGALSDGDAAADTVAENAANGATVGITASATDADGSNNTIAYSLTDDAGGRFTIDASTGIVTVANGSLLDAEAAATHQIAVQAIGSDGSSSSRNYSITLQGVNDNVPDWAMAQTNMQVAERTTFVTTVAATDADLPASALSFSIVGGSDAAQFAINSTSGALTFSTMPNYMAPTDANGDNRYEVMVRVSDGLWTRDVMLQAEVTDQPEPYMPPPVPPSTNDGRPSSGDGNTASQPKPTTPTTPTPESEPEATPGGETDNTAEAPPTLEEALGGNAATNPNNSAAEAILGYAPSSAGSSAATRAADAAALRSELTRFQLNLLDSGMGLNWLMPDMSIQVLTALNESLNPVSPMGIPASGLTIPDTLSFVESKDDDSGPLATHVPQAMKASGMAMTLGTIWWASRASGLVASMMVSAPAWRGIDPLPVLFDRPEGEGAGPEGGDEPPGEDALAEQMFDNRTRSALDAASIG